MSVSSSHVWMSDAFWRALNAASPWLFEAAWRKIAYFLDVAASSPAALIKVPRVQHLRDQGIDVLEIDASGRHRMLADYSHGRLTMLRLGEKPVVPTYTNAMYVADMAAPAPHELYRPHSAGNIAQLGPDEFFGIGSRPDDRPYDVADEQAWLYFLDDQQGQAAQEILDLVASKATYETDPVFLIGAPGTGKTAVLLNLLVRARQLKLRAAVSLSSPVDRYTELCGVSLDGSRWIAGDRGRKWDLLLIDDPKNFSEIEAAIDGAFGQSRVVVIAFDPMQLKNHRRDEPFTDALFDRLRGHGDHIIRLRQCYRQRSVLGLASKRTLDVLAASSPYFRQDKTVEFKKARARLIEWANDIEFVYEGGSEIVYESVTKKFAKTIVADIVKRDLWTHAPGLAIAVEWGPALRWPWEKWLGDVRYCIVDLKDSDSIKGLEFQHVVIVLGESLYRHVSRPFVGVNQTTYESRKLLRIPFTRARESMTVLVVSADEYSAKPLSSADQWKMQSLFWRRSYK